MDYTGNKCKSCGREFVKNDDIVVCPDCGTPYHRECYKKEGKCINSELHEKKSAWKPEKTDTAEKSDIKICSKCGADNKNTSNFCENCGASLNNKPQSDNINTDQNKIYEEINENLEKEICDKMGISDEEMDGVKLSEMAYFVKYNIYYYISVFKKFKATGKKISMNFICFLVPYYYFSSRKMYLWSFISFAVMMFLSLPQFINIAAEWLSQNITVDFINTSAFSAILNTSSFLMIAFKVIMAFTANWLYCKHTIKTIKNIKSVFPENQWNYNIMRKGGTSFLAVIVTLFIEIAFAVMIMSVICAVLYALQI